MDIELINNVIEQIRHDIEMDDTEALYEFLVSVSNGQNKRYFVGYLSEQRANDLGYELNTNDDE
jgi:hypothetical protein